MSKRRSQELNDGRRFLLRQLARHAYRTGEFQLKCGIKSHEMVDCSRVLRSHRELRALGPFLHDILGAGRVHGVGGPITGSDPLAVALMMARPGVYWCGVRPEWKGRGIRPGVVVGPVQEGHRIVVVDDVLTSGGSLLRAVHAFRSVGAVVTDAIVLVDRGMLGVEGLRDPLDAIAEAGVTLHALFDMPEIRAQVASDTARDAMWRRYV